MDCWSGEAIVCFEYVVLDRILGDWCMVALVRRERSLLSVVIEDNNVVTLLLNVVAKCCILLFNFQLDANSVCVVCFCCLNIFCCCWYMWLNSRLD